MKKTISIFVAIGFFLIIVTAVGSFSEKKTEVQEYYTKNSIEKTGSANIVNAIVWDFRSYDTLGEETVLFTAIIAIFLIAHKKSIAEKKEVRG
ncbi:MAG: hypothetical protein KAI53_02425 [Candidatus Aenigmarchaeota archaeon]|nr:hypothetical protein [Candidatus Aenigmarchaeota archaeon]